MRRSFNEVCFRTVAIAAAVVLLLTGCSSGVPTSTEVTRFHLGQTFDDKTVNIEAGEKADADSLEYQTYEKIVSDEMSAAGFTVVPGDQRNIHAVIDVTRGVRYIAPTSSPVRVGFGTSTYGSGTGMGAGVSTPVGGSSGGEAYVTELEVKLVDQSQKAVIWEGRALHTAEDSPADRNAVMQLLANSLFAEFPGKSGKTVKVE